MTTSLTCSLKTVGIETKSSFTEKNNLYRERIFALINLPTLPKPWDISWRSRWSSLTIISGVMLRETLSLARLQKDVWCRWKRPLCALWGRSSSLFIDTLEHPASSWLHLLLHLRIMETAPLVSHCVRIATHSGWNNQLFTSCYKFSLALYNATFHQAVLCFKKLRP